MIELARMRQQNQQAPPMITEDSSKQPLIQAVSAINESVRTATNPIPTTTAESETKQQQQQQQEKDATTTELSTSIDEQDDKLHTLLFLLSERSRTSTNLTTVPSPLTRRILNRQGVNYLDENVGHLVSIAADQFIATVISQAIACRDHRLEGEEFTRKNKRKRNQLKRRNKKVPPAQTTSTITSPKDMLTRAKQNLVQAHHSLKAAATTSSTTNNTPTTPLSTTNITSQTTSKSSPKFGEKPKTKKEVIASLQRAVATAHAHLIQMEIAAAAAEKKKHHQQMQTNDKDSVDEVDDDEEGDDISSDSEEEEDEDDEQRYVIRLRDIVRPLESWGIPMTGKIGLVPNTSTTISENRTNERSKSHPHESKLLTPTNITNATTTTKS